MSVLQKTNQKRIAYKWTKAKKRKRLWIFHFFFNHARWLQGSPDPQGCLMAFWYNKKNTLIIVKYHPNKNNNPYNDIQQEFLNSNFWSVNCHVDVVCKSVGRFHFPEGYRILYLRILRSSWAYFAPLQWSQNETFDRKVLYQTVRFCNVKYSW